MEHCSKTHDLTPSSDENASLREMKLLTQGHWGPKVLYLLAEICGTPQSTSSIFSSKVQEQYGKVIQISNFNMNKLIMVAEFCFILNVILVSLIKIIFNVKMKIRRPGVAYQSAVML